MITKGIIFDMDGLLVDSEKVYYQANMACAQELGFEITPQDYQAILGTTDAHLRAYFLKKLGSESKVETFIQLSYKKVADIIQADGVQIKPGLTQLLDYCDDAGITRVIASSNFKGMVTDFMQSTGLSNRFDKFVTGDDVNQSKPNPEIFLKALNLLSLPTTAALVLEDSPNGILAASRAKIPAIMVPDLIAPTPQTQQTALATVSTLADVIPYLKK